MLNAILIENSLSDKDILKEVHIDKTWQDGEWVLHSVKIKEDMIPALQSSLAPGPWYVHLWKDDKKEILVVFKDKSFTIQYADRFISDEVSHHINDKAINLKPDVILVDGNAEYLITAKQYVEALGYSALTAHTPYDALEIIHNLSGPAILLADYDLPEKTGLELINEIEKATRFPIESVLVTTESNHKILALAKQIGCDYFVKEATSESPVNLGELYKSHIFSAEGKLKERFKWMSKKMDSLTGLYDRESVMDAWVQEWKRAQRNKTVTACIFIDVNDLKPVNDMYGHIAGDEILRGVAKSIRHHVRAHDLIVRYGGDEFAIILPETSKAEAFDIIERLRRYLEQTPIEVAQGVMLNASIAIGVALLGPDKLDEDPVRSIQNLYQQADRMMYKNKMAYKAKMGGFFKSLLFTLRSTWMTFLRSR